MKPEELTRTIALYQHTGSGTMIVSAYYAGETDSKMYARVSEPLTITFTPRAQPEIMAAAVSALDAQIVEAHYAKVVEKCGSRQYWENWAEQAVRSLEQRKAELLALPAPEAV